LSPAEGPKKLIFGGLAPLRHGTEPLARVILHLLCYEHIIKLFNFRKFLLLYDAKVLSMGHETISCALSHPTNPIPMGKPAHSQLHRHCENRPSDRNSSFWQANTSYHPFSGTAKL